MSRRGDETAILGAGDTGLARDLATLLAEKIETLLDVARADGAGHTPARAGAGTAG